MEKVTVHMFGAPVPEGAHVVAAFPSVGLVATITATYLVEELGLAQVGVMDSPRFPTLSVVEHGEPLNPVRVYAGRCGPAHVVVFLSEFQPSPELVRPVSEALLQWARQHKCASIVTPEGLVMEEEPAFDGDLDVFAASSTPDGRHQAVDAGATLFQEGIVAGVTGVLLNLGKRDQFQVTGILSEAEQGQPDARSATGVIEWLGRVLGTPIDTGRLRKQAEAFDDHLGDVKRRIRLQEGGAVEGDTSMFG